MSAKKKLGAELLFESGHPGGTITEVFEGGVAKRMKLLVDDVIFEISAGFQVFLLNSATDAASISIPAGATVSILFRKASDNKLHRRTLVVLNYSYTQGDQCYKALVDEDTYTDVIVGE
jgi:hypothetical protein